MKCVRVCIPFYSEFEAAKTGCRKLHELGKSKSDKVVVWNGYEWHIEPRQGVFVHELRNSLVSDNFSYESPYPVDFVDNFLFVDSDIVWHPQQAINIMESGCDVIGAAYKRHAQDFYCSSELDAIGRIVEKYPSSTNGFRKVGHTGVGFASISKSVFQKMTFPWFWPGKEALTSCEVNFCHRCKSLGIDVYCNFDVVVGHLERDHSTFDWSIL